MAAETKIEGLDALHKKFEILKDDVRTKGGRFALRKAAQLVRDKGRANYRGLNKDDPDTGRRIDENIVERWNGRYFKATGDLAFRVGVTQGAVLPKRGEKPDTGSKGATPHWRLLEFGTEQMAASPFLRKALEQNIGETIDTFVANYDKALTRALAKGK